VWTLGGRARFVAEGLTCYGATGGIDSGYTTFLADCPSAHLTLVTLANSTDPRGAPDRVALELLHELARRR